MYPSYFPLSFLFKKFLARLDDGPLHPAEGLGPGGGGQGPLPLLGDTQGPHLSPQREAIRSEQLENGHLS